MNLFCYLAFWCLYLLSYIFLIAFVRFSMLVIKMKGNSASTYFPTVTPRHHQDFQWRWSGSYHLRFFVAMNCMTKRERVVLGSDFLRVFVFVIGEWCGYLYV